MNVEPLLNQMELAIYELAEAESHEKRAKTLRLQAAKRIASIHAETKAAHIIAVESRRQPQHSAQHP